MHLDNWTSHAQTLIDQVLAVDTTGFCRKGVEGGCPEDTIDTLIADAIESAPYGFQKQQCEFIRSVCSVQTDGRSCFGFEKQRNLKELVTTDKWRLDLNTVKAGIITRMVVIEQSDLNAINHKDDERSKDPK